MNQQWRLNILIFLKHFIIHSYGNILLSFLFAFRIFYYRKFYKFSWKKDQLLKIAFLIF